MDYETIQPTPWEYVLTSQALINGYQFQFSQENNVRWTQTPDSHIFSVDFPGMRKEEIKVEIEDSVYLIIRTVSAEEGYKKKFRLPESIDIAGITAGYEESVLTVIVPKRRRGLFIHPSHLSDTLQLLARAA